MDKRPKTGGRQKGSVNKRTLLVAEIVSKYKYDPLEILMMFAQGDWEGLGYESDSYIKSTPDGEAKLGYVITPEMRVRAASEVSQYMHAKKKEQIEPVDEPIEVMSREQKIQLLRRAEKEMIKLKEEINEPILDAPKDIEPE